MPLAKNVAAQVEWRFVDQSANNNTNPEFWTPRTGISGAAITVKVSKDGGAPFTASSQAVEVANGIYRVNLTASEMNADLVVVRPTTSVTSPNAYAWPPIIEIHTDPDWETDVFGAGHAGTTDSLKGIAQALVDAQVPIVRDD